MSQRVKLIQRAHMLVLHRSCRRFERALADPRRAQLERLKDLVKTNRHTAYGRAHGFDRVRDLATFQSRVPIVDYAELAPWVNRVAAGERGVLTTEMPTRFERSSGSTLGNKLIPQTPAFGSEFSAATSPWFVDMDRRWPALRGTRSYWSLSPVARARVVTSGGIPVGVEDDTEYLSPLERWVFKHLLAVSSSVARASNMEAWRRQTLQQLLVAQDLGLFSVWSPTFLIRLMSALEKDLASYLRALPGPVATAIQRRLDTAGEFVGHALWPRLRVISCWMDGPAAAFVPELRRYFPETTLEPKGLLATEGVVSIPFGVGPGAVPAVTSHLLEFAPVDADSSEPPCLVDELVPGRRYVPLLTTGAGFYRYRLGDVVQVEQARCQATPRIRFVGRMDGGSDLCGEKLDPHWVGQSLAGAQEAVGIAARFAMLVTERGTLPTYRLLVECADSEAPLLPALGEALEARLLDGYHYKYCRELGQLGAVEVRRVHEGWARYEKRLIGEGMRAGDIKPRVLDVRDGWTRWFQEATLVP